MNTLLNDRDEDLEDRHERTPRQYNRQDREINLGTTMILGIFFALAVICAAFFGFGYSTGRHSALTTPGLNGPSTASSNGVLKPGAGSPFGGQTTAQPSGRQEPSFQGAPPPTYSQSANYPVSDVAAPPPLKPAPTPERVISVDPTPPLSPAPAALEPPKPAKATPVAAPAPTTAVPSASGQFMVQVAAVSHQEDADLLVTSLKRRGYGVAIHNEPQDKLLHVQIGPFASRAGADAMRQRLLGDGFNAIVK